MSKSKTESESGFGNLAGSLGMALASSLASSALHSNAQAQQGYPAQQQSGGGGVFDSILGALGTVYIYNLNFIKSIFYIWDT